MIVRESPKSRAKTSQPNWPPQSSHEALLSSPSGRRKYEQRRERNSLSPSPSKARRALRDAAEDDDDDEEEDEETLHLKLQAIEAKLKLKALQKARKAAEASHSPASGVSSRSGGSANIRRTEISRPSADVQVPVSPVRKTRPPEEQRSPARVLLGIDKGLRAQDVSLKRPSVGSSGGATRTGPAKRDLPKIKSFSERMAESRNKEREREEHAFKVEQRRKRGFGLQNIESLKSRTQENLPGSTINSISVDSSAARTLSKEQGRPVKDSRNAPPTQAHTNDPSKLESARQPAASTQPPANTTAAKYAEISSRDNNDEAPSFDSFSSLHLKNREMQHNVVTRTLEGKTIFTIPQLLKTVKGPEYDPPDWENDYVVLGIIASKSEPLNTKNTVRTQSKGNQERGVDQQGKFMVIHLTDLKWELDLYLFDTGFSSFWKLSVGTLIAVLNPDIMPPRNRDTGKFSLKLTSSDDTVLEIGTARDLDFCHAKRKDGKECGQWIDSRKTEYCEFHIQLQVEKSKRGRMEVNTMAGYGRGGGSAGRFSGGRGAGSKGDDLRREGRFHDRETHETVFIAPRPGGAAKLLDRDEQSWERGGGREERFRRQLAEKEKEKELAKNLAKMGNGSTGGDYMKIRSGQSLSSVPENASNSSQDKPIDIDLRSLLDRKADDVSLAPAKRKRIASGKSTASNEPVGWSGAFKRNVYPSPTKEKGSILRMLRETSPVKKKARLLLPEKGIREPGRESIGKLDVGMLAAMDDDDDDLEVV